MVTTSTLCPDLHVGPALWHRRGPGSPERVHITIVEHRFDTNGHTNLERPGTWARIRRADWTTVEGVPGSKLENV